AGDSRAGQIRLSELPQRVWKNTAQIASDNVGMLMAWPLAMVIGPGGLAVLSVLLSLVILLGYVSAVRERITAAEILVPLSLLLTVLWPWDTTRFIFPLTSLLVYSLIVGVGAIMRRLLRNSYTLSKEGPLGAMSVAAWVIAALAIIGNLQYISLMDHPRFKMSASRAGRLRSRPCCSGSMKSCPTTAFARRSTRRWSTSTPVARRSPGRS